MAYYQGDYYAAGGFFKKLVRKVGGVVKTTSRLAGKVAPIVTAVNPAIGMGMSSYAQVGGRVGEMFATPAAAPAGLPMEGSPPAAPVYQAATYGGMDPQFMQLLLMLLMQRRR